jgi:hypothetical protein
MFETYIINLPKHTKRWASIESQLQKSDLKNCRKIKGVYGSEAVKDPQVLRMLNKGVLEVAKSGKRDSHDQHSIGSVGESLVLQL